MPNTPQHNLPYPAASDTPDVPRDIQALADGTSAALTVIESRTISAGSGLTGGGSLAASRTVNVGAGTGISVAADSVSVDTAWGDGRYVTKTGATMTGQLSVPTTPTASAHATSKGYVDSRIWQGSQAAYDAIGTKDPTVLYVII